MFPDDEIVTIAIAIDSTGFIVATPVQLPGRGPSTPEAAMLICKEVLMSTLVTLPYEDVVTASVRAHRENEGDR